MGRRPKLQRPPPPAKAEAWPSARGGSAEHTLRLHTLGWPSASGKRNRSPQPAGSPLEILDHLGQCTLQLTQGLFALARAHAARHTSLHVVFEQPSGGLVEG